MLWQVKYIFEIITETCALCDTSCPYSGESIDYLFCDVSGRFFLKIGPSLSSQTSVNTYQTGERHISKGGIFLMLWGSVITDILTRTTQNRVLLEKSIFAQLVKKFQIFHRIQISLQISQEPTKGPYPEPVHCNPYFSTFLKIYLHIFTLFTSRPTKYSLRLRFFD